MNLKCLFNSKPLPWLDGLGLLALRIWVGQVFLLAGYQKLSAGWLAPEWFAELSFPFPQSMLPVNLNWGVAGIGEVSLGLLILAGATTRLASLGLLYITFVAVYTVHFDLGWAGWNQIETDAGQGFMVPLMLAIMLLTILGQGAGQFSWDAVWQRKQMNRQRTRA